MKKIKILFQEPFVPKNITFGKFEKGAGNNTFPYGVSCVASYISKHGYDVSYLDPNLEKMPLEEYTNYVKSNKFDLIGIGSTTLQIDHTISCFKIIKDSFPHIITVLGGVHATLMPLETTNDTDVIDYLVLGEGEIPFYQLIEALNNGNTGLIKKIKGICFKQNGSVVCNPPDYSGFLLPDQIPIPLFDVFPMRKYVPQITYAKKIPSYSVVASRGCPFKCGFCNANDTMGSKLRYKPVDTLIDELKILKSKFNAKGVMFLDSTFTANKKWVREFCAKYIKSNLGLPWACNSRTDTVDNESLLLMKKSGCWSILYGVESANQKSLDLMNKGTTVEQNTYAVKLSLKLGFYVYTSYILCLPGETEEEVMNTIRYARSMGNQMAMFYLPVPFPKTKLWDLSKKAGELRLDAKWSDFNAWDFDNPVYINRAIGKKNMQKLYKKAYFIFYSDPKVWYRNFKEIILLRQSPSKFLLGIKGFLNMAFTR